MKSDTWYKLKVLVTPLVWFRSGRTSYVVTRALQHQLNLGHLPKRISFYTVKLGALELWGKNYPYAFGELRKANEPMWGSIHDSVLPARWMVLKLGALLASASSEKHIESYLTSKNALAPDKLRSSKPIDHGESS